MLAKTENKFRTAKELQLNDEQYESFLKVLELFESGTVESHTPVQINGEWFMFDMDQWFNTECALPHGHCGSICCIGGTAEFLMNKPKLLERGYPTYDGLKPDALWNLFYDWGVGSPTPARAAEQLRQYLETGECLAGWNNPENN